VLDAPAVACGCLAAVYRSKYLVPVLEASLHDVSSIRTGGCEGAIWCIEPPGYLFGEVIDTLLRALLTQLVGNRGALSYTIRLECGDGVSGRPSSMSACMVFAKFASRNSDVIGRHGRVKVVCVPQSTELAALEGLTPP
jgi:hypothetical protein